jgi:hypothetical protein
MIVCNSLFTSKMHEPLLQDGVFGYRQEISELQSYLA